MSRGEMSKDKMPETTSKTMEGIPRAFSKNTAGYSKWVFDLRLKLYCTAKQDPKYRFYTLYGLVCKEEVLEAAWRMVSRNKGSAGADGVSIESILKMEGGVKKYLDEIRQDLLNKSYEPGIVKRVYIPKSNGKLRPLGIPTVRDRVVQAAVLIVIEPIFEADFLDCSYGFRPGRSGHDALKEIQVQIRAGSEEVYDADMEAYFDSIPHDKLIACVERRITDGSIIKLIRQWLKAIVKDEPRDGGGPTYKRSKCGTPQGGVISPLLANLYLHFFDLLFQREYKPENWPNARLVRYADDFVILAKKIDAGMVEFIENTLENRMGLKINREKTEIRSLQTKGNNLEFLGYVYRKEKAMMWQGYYNNMLPSPKSLKRIREKIRDLTSSDRSFVPITTVIKQMNQLVEGWSQYFSLGYCAPAYNAIDQYSLQRLKKHLKRRSQRGYRRRGDHTWYKILDDLGRTRLSAKLRSCVGW